ncbi:HAMP domain-containing protein [Pseudoduganella eburnea]|uniref:histidine kinase n=1 Tax=Massilia eburnea TaxID=1776165 RepID=A0A6L6QIT1_9BURK|nr:HAMP domain-containing sensor histidine kinase [Massilia eburnea]MTW11546.1 HAMP domain-containing protein [Massilia eburnea]
MFIKLSFRQLLLGVFLLIALLLSATSIQALFTLDQLAAESRAVGQHAVALTANVQRLAERSVAMERSARQFLVLDDPAFRDRYDAARRDGEDALAALSNGLPSVPKASFAAWREQGEQAWNALQAPRSQRKKMLNVALAGLPAINDELAEEVKREVDQRNQRILLGLEHRRSVLAGQLLATISLAAALAVGCGFWLSRPLAQIEGAIGRLGGNRYDQPIEVEGPDDLRRLGQQLNWLRQRLASLEADKSRFLRHISHELKTPLAALVEGVALLEDEVAGTLTANQREVAGILRQNTASLQNQIEDLLRYNTATFAAQHLQRQPTDIAALLRDAVDAQRLQWQARRLEVTVEGNAPAIAIDPGKLAIAASNLLSNALRYSPEGGAIRFIIGEQAGTLAIDCIDQGPGVAAEDAAHIFEPFYQGERQPPGARRGNGVGLSIVLEYVNAHGGSLQLLPAGAGAHFRIELPYDY